MNDLLQVQSTTMLKQIAKKMNQDMRPEAGDILGAVLDVLQARLSSAEFITFCESLE